MSGAFPLASTAERLRDVFQTQDSLGSWDSKLSSEDIELVRTAAAASTAWLSLLTAEHPPLQPVLERLRPHLVLAAVNGFTRSAIHAPLSPDDPRYEPDPGPPLGYPRHSHPFRLLGKDPPHTQSEEGALNKKLVHATTGLLAGPERETTQNPTPFAEVLPDHTLRKPLPPQPCAPSTPVVALSSPASPASSGTFLSLLGTDSTMARNAVQLHNLRVLRHRAQAAIASYGERASTDVPMSSQSPRAEGEHTKPRTKVEPYAENPYTSTPGSRLTRSSEQELTVISNTAKPNPATLVDEPQLSKMQATTALVLAHSGFTHASSAALDVLTDAAVQFIERLGQTLSTCRVVSEEIVPARRDHHGVPIRSTDQFLEEMRRISTAGFRGGFPELQGHARGDMMRKEQALREADRKIREQLFKIRHSSSLSDSRGRLATPASSTQAKQDMLGSAEHRETSDIKQEGSTDIHGSEVNTQLNTDAFAFGYLSQKVHLDILNGVRVPRRLAYRGRTAVSGAKSFGADAGVGTKRKRSEGKSLPAQGVRVKLEAKTVEANSQ